MRVKEAVSLWQWNLTPGLVQGASIKQRQTLPKEQSWGVMVNRQHCQRISQGYHNNCQRVRRPDLKARGAQGVRPHSFSFYASWRVVTACTFPSSEFSRSGCTSSNCFLWPCASDGATRAPVSTVVDSASKQGRHLLRQNLLLIPLKISLPGVRIMKGKSTKMADQS